MLNKNDPLISAVQQVMQQSNAEREAVKVVNEYFGIEDRKALPHERQGQWDAAYQQVLSEGVEALDEDSSLAGLAPPYSKTTRKDVLVGRGVLKKHPTQPHKHVLAKEQAVPKVDPHGGDQTKPSEIKKGPDYAPAGTTPDYAKPKTQTVNRDEKTSLPPGTMKEEKESKFSKVMREFMKRKLHSGSKKGPVVTDPKQAKAIAASEAGIARKK